MSEKIVFHFSSRVEWREWLKQHHSDSGAVWLIYFKKHTAKPGIRYEEAVEEALCFGWIDSRVNRLDDERYMQQFTRRKPRSVWSQINKNRVLRLIEEGLMTEAGLKLVEEAKKSGWWEKAYTSGRIVMQMPVDLENALKQNKQASEHFFAFTDSQKSQYIAWIEFAKRKETRQSRIQKVVQRSAENIKPGLL